MSSQLLDGSRDESEENLSVHLAEITSLNWPSSESLIYKCRVAIHSPFESKPLVRELPARSNPAWMLDFQHQGTCHFKLALLVKDPVQGGSWTELGEVDVDSEEALTKETAVNVSLPISDWELAPRLRLKMRLYKTDRPPGRRQRGLGRLPRVAQESRGARNTAPAFLSPVASQAVETPDEIPMTPQEKVIVKDSWNKFLAFKELSLDMYIKRLLAVEPSLDQATGVAIDLLAETFFGLFDLTVRQLIPHTEQVLREAYRGVHPSSDRECNSIEEYGNFFASMGVRPHHWLVAREVWMWVLPTMPYIEEYERGDLEKREHSALHKFFTGRVLRPMLLAIEAYDRLLPPASLERIRSGWQVLGKQGGAAGRQLYEALEAADPRVAQVLEGLDTAQPAKTVFASFEGTVEALRDWDRLVPELRQRDAVQRQALPIAPVELLERPLLGMLGQHIPGFDDGQRQDWRNMFSLLKNERRQPKTREDHVLQKATEYLTQFADEWGWTEGDLERRLKEIADEIAATGSYAHTYEELAFGMQLAWRNSSKCIGRMQWKNLLVRDVRHIQHPDEIFEECIEHLRVAHNFGRLQSVMSIFRPRRPGERWGPRIWNSQLLRYAGYRQSDGTILGDPANASLTDAILKLGWTPPSPKSQFDVLPLVIEVPGKQPSVYELPRDMILEVPLEHPTMPQLAEMGLRWNAVPAISNFRILLGGVDYGCLPFNGWFLCTEIARNLTDATRYNKVEEIARALGLDMKNEQTMWRDEAYLQLNKAIIHSFQKQKVIIADQHSASRQFLTHDLREKEAGRECPAQWSWVVPPLGGSVCPVYHHEMRDFLLEPQYYHAADRWAVQPEGGEHAVFEEQVLLEDEQRGETVESMLILFSTASVELEHLARLASRRLDRFAPRLRSFASFDPSQLVGEKVVLWITATDDSGDDRGEVEKIMAWLSQQPGTPLKGSSHVVSSWGNGTGFAVARSLDQALGAKGGFQLLPLQRTLPGMDAVVAFNRSLGLLARNLGRDELFVDDANLGLNSRLSIMPIEDGSAPLPFSPAAILPRPRRAVAKVVRNSVLEVGSSSKSLRRVVLDLGDVPGRLQGGQVVHVHQATDPQQIGRLCQRLDLQPQMRLTARFLGSFGEALDTELPFAVPTTVEQLLSRDVDFTLWQPLDDWLQFLWQNVDPGSHKEELEETLRRLRVTSGTARYAEEMSQLMTSFGNICDLLEHYSTARVTLADVLGLVRYQGGQRFSVAEHGLSSEGQQVAILVEAVTDGQSTGGCAAYLASRQPGDVVDISASGLGDSAAS